MLSRTIIEWCKTKRSFFSAIYMVFIELEQSWRPKWQILQYGAFHSSRMMANVFVTSSTLSSFGESL